MIEAGTPVPLTNRGQGTQNHIDMIGNTGLGNPTPTIGHRAVFSPTVFITPSSSPLVRRRIQNVATNFDL